MIHFICNALFIQKNLRVPISDQNVLQQFCFQYEWTTPTLNGIPLYFFMSEVGIILMSEMSGTQHEHSEECVCMCVKPCYADRFQYMYLQAGMFFATVSKP